MAHIEYSLGDHNGKIGTHIERQQKCFRNLQVKILLTQMLLNINTLISIDQTVYRTTSSSMGGTVAQWVMLPSFQLRGLWFDPDPGLRSVENFPFFLYAFGPVHTWY